MLSQRFNYPDLDVLESPMISPAPNSFRFSVPGSALAERIFNDPESWEDTDADDSDIPDDIDGVDPLEWLTEEIEKFRAGIDTDVAHSDSSSESPSTPTDKAANLVTTPTSAATPTSALPQRAGAIKRVKRGSSRVRPISLAALFNSNEDFSHEIQQQLSKILESGGIPHHIRPPHSSALSPPSTSGTSSTLDTPLHLQTSILGTSSGEISPSPVNIYSASATLSFLEWYGIYPDSPRLDVSRRLTKSARLRTPLLQVQVPSPRHPVQPSPLLSTPPASDLLLIKPAKEESRTASPPRFTDSPSPVKAGDAESTPVQQQSSERGRALRMTAPLPSREPSPAPPVRSNSSASNRPRGPTPVRGLTGDQPIRRLPSIPRESSTSRPSTPPQPLPQPPVQTQTRTRSQSPPQPLPQLPVQAQAPCPSRSETPPKPPQRVVSPPRHASPGPAAQQPQGQAIGPRPVSVRSPLGGPAGPRTRSRASYDTTGKVGSLGHRPPVLRL
ncbi:hypothetical protein GALMADRAFT_212821 [Galerina marginata CBS 339.88]|uniref:Uncharacterized protein n=1 Tax=Galerina marginata (strain CBS 339.88) TaxID=685588 RepID=A0A067T188_GALM3|nr:hypothetical protein GALMADRAFT_212821 [Galerina marginata CBS 339.88]